MGFLKPDHFKNRIRESADAIGVQSVINDFVHWALGEQLLANRSGVHRKIMDQFKATDKHARSISLAAGQRMVENFRLSENWFQTLYFQYILACGFDEITKREYREAAVGYYGLLGWNVELAEFPKSSNVNTVLPCTFNLEGGGSFTFNLVFIPTDNFPAGCNVKMESGKLYEVSVKEGENYLLISHERDKNGKYTHLILTPWQMERAERID